jgi:hypothetical protein
MRGIPSVLLPTILIIVFASCKKEENTNHCFSGVSTVRQITNRPAVIKVTATVYGVYIVEQGAIDTKLIPCNLPAEFMQHDLPVTISGDVKATPRDAGPCCAENFVITEIKR